MSTMTIIVDTRQIDRVTVPQLADYLSFVALAQLRPQAAPARVESILSLFSGNAAPAGLTRFDRAYLTGLYASTPNAVGTIQKMAIGHSVAADLKAAPDGKTPPTGSGPKR